MTASIAGRRTFDLRRPCAEADTEGMATAKPGPLHDKVKVTPNGASYDCGYVEGGQVRVQLTWKSNQYW